MKSAFDRTWVQSTLHDVVTRCGSEADGLEACFTGSECSNMRLAETSIIQASDITRGKVSIRAIRGRSSAQASTTDLTADGVSG